ncbi:MAG: hypothetical protein AB1758_14680 [Candidatus Eremiobacterota bacterium]
MHDRLPLELDTPLEYTLKALTTLGVAASLVLALAYLAFPTAALKAALLGSGLVAGLSALLASQLNNFYVLDMDHRKIVYVSNWLGHVREVAHPFEQVLATSILGCVEYGRGYPIYYTAPALVLRNGQVLRVGDYEAVDLPAYDRARMLSEAIGCPFREVGPRRSIAVQVDSTTGQVELCQVPAPTGGLSTMLLCFGGVLVAMALLLFVFLLAGSLD